MSIVDRIRDEIVSWRPDSPFDDLAGEAFEYQFERLAPYRQLCLREGKTPESVDSWREMPLVPAAGVRHRRARHRPAARDLSLERHARHRAQRPPPSVPRALPRRHRRHLSTRLPAARRPSADAGAGAAARGGRRFVARLPGRPRPRAPRRARFGLRLRRPRRRGRRLPLVARRAAARRAAGADPRHRLRARRPARPHRAHEPPLPPARRQRRVRDRRLQGTAARDLPRGAARPRRHLARHPGGTGRLRVRHDRAHQPRLHPHARRRRGGALRAPAVAPRARPRPALARRAPPDGEPGLLAFFDLANVGSALHVLTEDLGAVESGGFRLDGRAPDADLRGCSLLAEELGRGASSG
jgi:hypothetical protein